TPKAICIRHTAFPDICGPVFSKPAFVMKVFKFGGASVNSLERIQMAGDILEQYNGEKILVVISAMGKTTNALETVVQAFVEGRKDDSLKLFEQVKQQHLTTAKYLLVTRALACEEQLKDFFTEVEWLLHDKPVRNYDYYYDQVVCTGELLSTTIISHYLTERGINNDWIDVRDIIRTDDNFRDANVDWEFTLKRVNEEIVPRFEHTDLIITQGFIGATDENESIWKDVESVMNADPRVFPEACPIPELNYNEVIEMSYYGAQVIHPKTIKPIQNKGIPLYVKCFLDPSKPGTIIHNQKLGKLPPIIVLKNNQALLELRAKDFSFVGDHHVRHLFGLFEQFNLKPNLTQNGAISFLCVLDDHAEKIQSLAIAAATLFDVQLSRDLSLITIRHYDDASLAKYMAGKKVILRQQTTDTLQALLG